jgi:patatin-like phospholipase/acyl hydrolase
LVEQGGFMAKKVARILSIDGGGIRGLMPATVLEYFERTLGAPLANRFHLVAGTSTGGILGAALCAPRPLTTADMVRLYRDEGPKIFDKTTWHTVASLGGTVDEKYSATELEKSLSKRLSGWLSDVSVADLLVTAYDIESRDPLLFKSWAARGLQLDAGENSGDRDFKLVDVARATAAAPTYFEPAGIRARSGKSRALVDGGMYAGNPGMCAYAAARRLYPNADEYLIISLGTGQLQRPIPLATAKHWGLVGWARPIIDVIFDGVSDTVDYQLQQLTPQVQTYRFQISLAEGGSVNDDMDDASSENLARLSHLGQRILEKQASAVQRALTALAAPKTPLADLGYPTPVA